MDPHSEREAAQYENPIASREYIQQVLAEADQPLSHARLCSLLELRGEQQAEALRRRLRAMERDGQLLVNRAGHYGLVDKMDLVRGRVLGHRDGYGFLQPIAGGDDLYLSARQMALVFDGDEALARVSRVDHRGRKEGKIVEVLRRGLSEVVGRYYEESGIGAVVPDNSRVGQDILIPPQCRNGARHGEVVCARITSWPTRRLGAKGEIAEVLGEHMDPGLEIDVAIRSHGIPHQWPEAVLGEAAALADAPSEADKSRRVDLRELAFVTIDGEDARDFDDAVYCERRRGGGWRLFVAIADVSHYVRPGTALDEEARRRGNSAYFPERVVPMLPEALSNGLCSLQPGVDRLAMICELRIARQGGLAAWQFYEGVIHSRARLTYAEVGEALETGGRRALDSALVPHLERLHGVYRALRRAREKRGAIDLETVETRILFDAQRKIESIAPVRRNDAHRLIEECMLAANVAAASFHEDCGLPALFRVHEEPGAERLQDLRDFLGGLGLDLKGGPKPTPLDYQSLLERVRGREDAGVIQTVLLRSLSQANYQPDNRGHFGLNYPAYIHFTSPIRRYPDLLAHRGIRCVLRSELASAQVRRAGAAPIPRRRIFPYQPRDMAVLGEHCSMTERRADDASREVESWLKCEYLQHRIGDSFPGVVAAVTGFGLFVELRELYIQGLVHISSLPSDYYHYDRAGQRLVGERGGRSFRLGDPLVVRLVRVALDDRQIDLELLEAASGAPERPGPRTRGRRGGARRRPASARDGRR